MRFRQVSTARLTDPDAELARRDHALAIVELQDVVRSLQVPQARWTFVARETLRSAAQEIAIGGLDGDRDEEYLVRGYLVTGGTGGDYTLRINGLEGTRYARMTAVGGAVSESSSTGIAVALGVANEPSTFEGVVYARSRVDRRYEGRGTRYSATLAQIMVSGEWTDRAANITSLGVRHTASSMAVGSWFEVYRRAG